MPQSNSEFWNKARLAREKLAKQCLNHPDVGLIDIGYSPETSEEKQPEVVLRIHVAEHKFKSFAEKSDPFPDEMDGFKVIVMHGNYKVE